MPQKIRIITLTGLMLVLAVGATAARPRTGEDKEHTCPARARRTCVTPCDGAGTCGMPAVQCPVSTSPCEEKTKDKCCCSPEKPCDNCPCKEKADAEDNSADRCGPEDFAIWNPGYENAPSAPGFCAPMNGNYSMAGLPYPVPGMHTPIPFSVCPPPLTPQMAMPQMVQMPQMPQMMPQFVSEPAREDKEYIVKMKLTEQRKGEKENVVAWPKLTVCEGKPAQMSVGTTHASLWSAGVPSNDFGHEGYQIDVVVKADKKNCVCLECWIWTSSPDASGISTLHESRCHTTQTVELDKAAKLSCGQHTLEVIVKELGTETVSGSTEPCEKPCCEPGTDGCKRVEQAHFVAPQPKEVKKPAKMTFTTIEGEACCEAGKIGDLNPPARLLKVCCDGVTLTCEKFDLEMPGCETVKVCVDGDRVVVAGNDVKAMADGICTGDEGVLHLQGHVRVFRHKGNVDVDSGEVRIKLEQCDFIQTGFSFGFGFFR